MTDPEIQAYVRAAAVVLQLPLDEARVVRVAMHLARTAAMAGALETVPLDVGQEPAEIYCPAPFPVLPAGPKPS